MRILIDGSLLRGPRTGCFTYLHHLLKHLAEVDPKNEYFLLDYPQRFQVLPLPELSAFPAFAIHPPSHYIQNTNPRYGIAGKVYNRLVPALADWLSTPIASQQAARLLKSIHVYSIVESGLFTHKTGATIVTIHDITTRTHPHLHLASNRRFHERKIHFAERHANLVIAASENTARDLLEHTSLSRERIRVVYPGAGADVTAITDSDECKRLLARFQLDNAPFLLSIGTLEPRKNWPATLAVFRSLRRKHKNLKLVIAGAKGWLADDILKQIAAHPEREAIVLAGFVTPQERRALYSRCAIFLFPSFYEGFGLPVLEAMGCGAPVVCSNASSLAEVGGEGALQTAPDNHEQMAAYCERLLDDAAYREGRIRAGFVWSRRFNWNDCARKVAEIFETFGP